MVHMKFVVTPSARDSCLKEAIVKLKISPLRLYVDQDVVEFLKTFFCFLFFVSFSLYIFGIWCARREPSGQSSHFYVKGSKASFSGHQERVQTIPYPDNGLGLRLAREPHNNFCRSH